MKTKIHDSFSSTISVQSSQSNAYDAELSRACGASIEATNQKLLLSRAKSTVDEVKLGLRLSVIISALPRFTRYSFASDNLTCGYSFLADERSFNFSTDDLRDVRGMTKFPTVLDWAIGTVTCQEAVKNSSSYICHERKRCVEC